MLEVKNKWCQAQRIIHTNRRPFKCLFFKKSLFFVCVERDIDRQIDRWIDGITQQN